jgi:hypothetical protein
MYKRSARLVAILCLGAGLSLHAQGGGLSSQAANPTPQTRGSASRPVEQDPFTWADFPKDIDGSKKIKEAYKQASSVKDGYRILQLAKIEFENVYTYGNLVPGKMLLETYNIALADKDPFLAFYVTAYDSQHNLFTLVPPEDMVKKTAELALERREALVLNRLADLEESYGFTGNKNLPKELRMKALFINNKDFKPYPNYYDGTMTGPARDLERSPLGWRDFVGPIESAAEMRRAYNEALASHDGYLLLKLASIENEKRYMGGNSKAEIFKQASAIASYNKDPYLYMYIALVGKQLASLSAEDCARFAQLSYDTAHERRDTKPLYLLYYHEKQEDFLPNIKPREIMIAAEQLNDRYKGEKLVGISY